MPNGGPDCCGTCWYNNAVIVSELHATSSEESTTARSDNLHRQIHSGSTVSTTATGSRTGTQFRSVLSLPSGRRATTFTSVGPSRRSPISTPFELNC